MVEPARAVLDAGRPAAQLVSANLEWNLWFGPAPEHPYGPGYHRGGWRGWWDFGTGALGDMACHTMNMPFAGLDLFPRTRHIVPYSQVLAEVDELKFLGKGTLIRTTSLRCAVRGLERSRGGCSTGASPDA